MIDYIKEQIAHCEKWKDVKGMNKDRLEGKIEVFKEWLRREEKLANG